MTFIKFETLPGYLIMLILATTGSWLKAAEPWSGRMDFVITTPEFTTDFRIKSNGQFWLYEMGREDDPHTVWLLNPLEGTIAEISTFKKTYSVRNTDPGVDELSLWLKTDRQRKKAKLKDSDIQPLGESTIQEIACRGFRLKTRGADTEVWLKPGDEPFPRFLFTAFAALREVAPDLIQLLQRQSGIPLRLARKNWRGKHLFLLEFKSIESRAIPDDLFVVPADYQRIAHKGLPPGPRDSRDRW